MSDLAQQLASIKHLPPAQKSQLESIIRRSDFKAYFSAAEVLQLLEHCETYSTPGAVSKSETLEQLLRNLVPLAQTYSLAPISNFKVGAVALTDSGAIYLGANMEFDRQTLNQSVHAEQAAISNAWHHNETLLTKLAVSATPCGHCRQFMNELAQASELQIYLPQQPPLTLSKLLPLSFGPTDLNVSENLMNSAPNQLNERVDDPLLNKAIEAARYSYSPYSNSPSGVALQTRRAIYTGRYAENCAYNPSLSPLQSALIALHLANDKFSDITAAVLADTKAQQVSQRDITKNLLAQLSEAPLSYYIIRI